MRLIVEKEFELWESRRHTEHDSPVIGCYREYETSRKSHGSFKTKKAAEKAKQFLIAKYTDSGVYKVSIESTSDTTILYESISDDIIIWVKEKVVSEKPTR